MNHTHHVFSKLLELASSREPITVAVCHPCSDVAMLGAVEAARARLIDDAARLVRDCRPCRARAPPIPEKGGARMTRAQAAAAADGGIVVINAGSSTAGIGENSVAIRADVCRGAAWLGVELDEAANVRGGPKISAPSSAIATWVIATDEEVMIARHTAALLAAAQV
jgi:hypothetical protein